jgi:hypothetical protein
MKHMASYFSPKSISQHIKPLQSYGVTKREERELKRELCRNTETTRHGEHTDPNWI